MYCMGAVFHRVSLLYYSVFTALSAGGSECLFGPGRLLEFVIVEIQAASAAEWFRARAVPAPVRFGR